MRKASKIYITLFSLLFVFGLRPLVQACSYGTEFEDIRYIILNPNLTQNKSWWTYFYTSKYHYMDAYVQGNQDEMEICKEWKAKFKLKSNLTDIEAYLFGELTADSMKKSVFYKEIQTNSQLKQYFNFAKECESVVHLKDVWYDYNIDSVFARRELFINKGKNYLKQQTDVFWQKKYAFQLLRMAYYQKNDVLFNNLYNTYFGYGRESSALDWWATHYKSMVVSDGDSAHYLHAMVFSRSSNKMFASRQNFSSHSFANLLKLARNNKEQADLYVLKAMCNSGKVIDDIKEVYKLDKNHPLLTLLLIREMNKIENWIGTKKYSYRADFFDSEWGETTKTIANDYIYLRAFYKQLQAMEIPAENADVFQLIRANLALMNQDAPQAKKYLSSVVSNDEQIVFQKTVLEIMLVSITENLQSPQTADKLGKSLHYLLENKSEQFESQKITFSLLKFLEHNFRSKGLNHIAGLFYYMAEEKYCNTCNFNSLEYNIVHYFQREGSTGDVEKVIDLFSKNNKTELEKFLLIPYPNTNYFKELLGTLYMRQGNTAKAREIYAQLPDEFWDNFDNLYFLDNDPFLPEGVASWQVYYNKFEIADRLVNLEESAKTNPQDLIKLGNAWFNFSTYGTSWFMLDYVQSTYEEEFSQKITQTAIERSLNYYQMAYGKLTEPEYRAQITYGLAAIYLHHGKLEESKYGYWADEYERYDTTEFYHKTNCMTTNLIQEAISRKYFFYPSGYE